MSRKLREYRYRKVHKLKHPSSFIVVVLRSLKHGGCTCCGKSIHSLEESSQHWEEELWGKDKQLILFAPQKSGEELQEVR